MILFALILGTRFFGLFIFFFFNDTATTEIYTLSLHDALPICRLGNVSFWLCGRQRSRSNASHMRHSTPMADRKSTRLNSSHLVISYAVFCLKKKKKSGFTPLTRLT